MAWSQHPSFCLRGCRANALQMLDGFQETLLFKHGLQEGISFNGSIPTSISLFQSNDYGTLCCFRVIICLSPASRHISVINLEPCLSVQGHPLRLRSPGSFHNIAFQTFSWSRLPPHEVHYFQSGGPYSQLICSVSPIQLHTLSFPLGILIVIALCIYVIADLPKRSCLK